MTTTAFSAATGHTSDRGRRRALWVACGAHALHDGLTDTLYLLLPILQTEFALSYAAIGALRALYAGAMAGLQVPAAKLAQRVGGPRMLAAGTAVAGAAYLTLGASSTLAILVVALILTGFALLLFIGVIDSATRMGFLTFLPFLLRAKGAGLPEIGVALTLIFAGGAAGKLVCGFLGARLGVLTTVLITEGATAAGILALLPLTIGAALVLLPIIGVALNGTSSVLYGTVPELVTSERRESAFGVFYTGTIGAGALAPALYGLLSDAIGLTPAMLFVAAVVLLTLPLAWQLTRVLRAVASSS